MAETTRTQAHVSTPGPQNGSARTRVVNTVRRRLRTTARTLRSQHHIARHVFNAAAVRRHRRSPIALDPAAAAMGAELRTRGIAISSVEDLLGTGELYQLTRQRASDLAAGGGLVRDPAKPFLTELYGVAPRIRHNDPLLQLAMHPQIRGIAEAYSGMKLRITDVNIWVNAPVAGSPTQSQRWHRDLAEDDDILKCFVYLSDVPDGAGPLHYVAATNTALGRKDKLPSEFDGIGYRLSDDDVTRHFGLDRVVNGRGTAGTLVFADTRGIHRGGFARDRERVVGQITYASRACSRPATLRPMQESDRRLLARDVRFAPSA